MIRIDDAVITAQTLEGRLAGERQVEIGPGSKLTPSAQDFLYAQGVEVVRRSDGMPTPATPAASQAPTTPAPAPSVPRTAGRQAFAGIFCPNLVLFDSQNEINHAEMERYINWLIEARDPRAVPQRQHGRVHAPVAGGAPRRGAAGL